MRKSTKKGFTIVELVVVIAIIAILAAVLIPTFSNLIKKANASADKQLVRNLNTALLADAAINGKHATMQAALDAVKNSGFDVARINDTKASDNEILWDSKNDLFCYFVKDGGIEYLPESNRKYKNVDPVNYWIIVSDVAKISPTYSNYLFNVNEASLSVTTGVDVGDGSTVGSITYTGSASGQEVVIRTNSDKTSLNVYAPADTVNFYGFAKAINVADVAPDSLHVFGAVNALAIKEGHVDIENTGIVFDIVQFGDKSSAPGNSGTISNKGYIAETSYSGHTNAPTEQQIEAAQALINNNPESTKNVGGDYEIASLEQLEAFRDAVNAGNTFAGLTAILKADITLKDGWKPIGEGSRSSYETNKNANSLLNGTAFMGEFDGNNKTIYNLNNKGFVPTSNRISPTDNEYVYGLFALTATGANIHDLTLKNVDIDGSRYTASTADSVGALVGASMGGIIVDNITVEGSVKATDAVGGIIGRCYNKDGVSVSGAKVVSLTNCINRASVSSVKKGAGLFGYISDNSNGNFSFTVKNNTNYGTVTCKEGQTSAVAVFDSSLFEESGDEFIINHTRTNVTMDVSGNKDGTTSLVLRAGDRVIILGE